VDEKNDHDVPPSGSAAPDRPAEDGRASSSKGSASRGAKPAKENPARQYNRPPDAKLVDVPGLLLVTGLVGAGLVIALIITGHLF
jgi:hypothetical protein